MKNAKRGILTIILVVLIAALLYIMINHYLLLRPQPEAEPPMPSEDIPVATPPAPSEEPEAEPVPQPSGETIGMTLAVGGDMMIHAGLNHEALLEDGSYDYAGVFSGAAELLKSADYAVATLETTFAGTEEYSGYPKFKSPDDLAGSLKELGVDLINTASDHALDSDMDGLVRTLDVLEENGLAHVGTYRSQTERAENNGITMAEVNGIKIAFLAYANGTNGTPIDNDYAVSLLYKDFMTAQSEVNYEMLNADMAAARESGADIVAVFMHWGLEYQTAPNAQQNELADYLFTQGADLILGGHTHVPQPMEMRKVTDLEGKEKTGYICYNLGNLVSCQVDINTNLTAIVSVELEKDLGSGEAYVKDVSYVPMFMMNLYDYNVTDAGWRYRLLNLHETLDAYESGTAEYLTEAMYRSMQEGLGTIHSIMGADFDAYNAQNTEE